MENFIETLELIDRTVFLFLNHLHHPIFDFLMVWASDKFIWIPFYGFLVYLIVKNYKFDSIAAMIAIGLVIIISDQVTSSFMKPFFERYRPCHDPELLSQVRILAGCGGRYGFASSHAANTFGLALFVWALLRRVYPSMWLMFVWAAFVSYSRIYLGVHYPSDIIAGAMTGILSAVMLFYVFKWFEAKTDSLKKDSVVP